MAEVMGQALKPQGLPQYLTKITATQQNQAVDSVGPQLDPLTHHESKVGQLGQGCASVSGSGDNACVDSPAATASAGSVMP